MLTKFSFYKSMSQGDGRRAESDRGWPSALCLMVALLFLGLVAVTPRLLQNPPIYGKASLDSLRNPQLEWEVVFDPKGWEEYLGDQDYFRFLMDVEQFPDGSVGIVGSQGWPEPQLESSGLFRGTPRAALRYGKDAMRAVSELYQTQHGLAVLSGPISVNTSNLLRPTEGAPLQVASLNQFPPSTERVAWIDFRSIELPKPLTDKLITEWKKWEFHPRERLKDALVPPFCYVVWDGAPILSVGVKDAKAVREELAERYPDSLIPKVVTWAAATRVEGLGRTDKPAWYLRGDSLVMTATGGVERLAKMLTERQEQGQLSFSTAFDEEFSRLAKTQNGWHVCLLDKSPKAPVWWALLLRLEDENKGLAKGFLILEVRPRQDWFQSES